MVVARSLAPLTSSVPPSFVHPLPPPAARPPRRDRRRARALYFPTDTEYIAAIGADYPDAGIANWEEARCLFSDHGYNILDIRCEVGD